MVKVSVTLDVRALGQGLVVFDSWSGATHFVDAGDVVVFHALPVEWQDRSALLRQLDQAFLDRDGRASSEQSQSFLNEMLDAGILLTQ